MRNFELTPEVEAILDGCIDMEKTEDALNFTSALLNEHELVITDYRWQSLANHVAAMVERSVKGEAYPDIDPTLFAEISDSSIEMAQKVADLITGLADSEKYLLSVHFETAKLSDKQ